MTYATITPGGSTGRNLYLSGAFIALGTAMLVAALVRPGPGAGSSGARSGGTFRGNFEVFDSIDPALGYSFGSWAVAGLTCRFLFTYPDRPAPVGFRVVRDAAARWPRVSRDGKTYTFTIKRGLRFSDGAPLTARNFARAIARVQDPDMGSPAGSAARAAEVRASGRTLVIKLPTPVPDLPARLTMPFFCPVPAGLPVDPEGVVSPIPGTGPYRVTSWVRGRRLVLERNRLYHGRRPRHFDRFVFGLGEPSSENLTKIKQGSLDWGPVPPTALAGLRRRYGVNRSRYHVTADATLYYLALNASRPLFRRNARLRRAVNFAVDRRSLMRTFGPGYGAPTDQYLPPSMPGFRSARLYPLARPNVRKARNLARGRTRDGKAVLYTRSGPASLALAQVVQRNLAKIGLDVEIREFPTPVFFEKLATPGEPFDIAPVGWTPDWVDPFDILNTLLHSHGRNNLSRFDSRTYDRRVARAARLVGNARYRTYGTIDVDVARHDAPLAAFGYRLTHTFVSRRIGCVVVNARGFDFAAACLKRH